MRKEIYYLTSCTVQGITHSLLFRGNVQISECTRILPCLVIIRFIIFKTTGKGEEVELDAYMDQIKEKWVSRRSGGSKSWLTGEMIGGCSTDKRSKLS